MKSVTCATLATAFFAAFSVVSAHGSVNQVASNGQSFSAPIPGSGSQSNSPVRVISTLEPITDPNSRSMACGPGAAGSAKAVAEVKPGASITYGWRSGESAITWGHRWGPILLYAYQCPEGVDATKCEPPTSAEWTLIDAQAFDSNPGNVPNSNGWVQDRFHNNMTVPSPVPKNLPNGDYLFRHEIIALHRAMDNGGEYYVSCTQVRVTGGSNGRVKGSGAQLVAIPGVYTGNEKGIRVNVFDNNLNAGNYVMPGPKIFNGKVNGGDGGAQNPGNSPAPSSSETGDAPAPTSSPSTCKRRVKKRSMRKHKKSVLRKRHIARAAAAAEGIALRSLPKRISGAQY